MAIYDGYGSRILLSESDVDFISNAFKTKTIGVIGDSITAGVGTTENSKRFVNLLGNDFASAINYGISSTLIADSNSYSNSFVSRYQNMSNALDYVVVFGGVNDYYHNSPMGTDDSVDTYTFKGALNVMIQGMLTKYVGKDIIFMTPCNSYYLNHSTDTANSAGNTMQDYVDAIKERCAYHGVAVLDLFEMSGMDVAHNTDQKAYWSSDGVHLSDAGNQRVYERLIGFLRTLEGAN